MAKEVEALENYQRLEKSKSHLGERMGAETKNIIEYFKKRGELPHFKFDYKSVRQNRCV